MGLKGGNGSAGTSWAPVKVISPFNCPWCPLSPYQVSGAVDGSREGIERPAFPVSFHLVSAMASSSILTLVGATPCLVDVLAPKKGCLFICIFKCFYYTYIFVYWGLVSNAQRATCWSPLSPPTMWVLGIELGSSNLYASAFPSWIISPSSPIFLLHINPAFQ